MVGQSQSFDVTLAMHAYTIPHSSNPHLAATTVVDGVVDGGHSRRRMPQSSTNATVVDGCATVVDRRQGNGRLMGGMCEAEGARGE